MQILDVATPILIVVLIAAAIWAVAEIALSARRVRKSLDEVDKTVASVEPLIERANLTVDALNLEIMRVDKILEDVGDVSEAASSASNALGSVAAGSAAVAGSLVEKIRLGVKGVLNTRKAQAALDQSSSESIKLPSSVPASLEAAEEPKEDEDQKDAE